MDEFSDNIVYLDSARKIAVEEFSYLSMVEVIKSINKAKQHNKLPIRIKAGRDLINRLRRTSNNNNFRESFIDRFMGIEMIEDFDIGPDNWKIEYDEEINS